jgi:site-specific DNA recombinase
VKPQAVKSLRCAVYTRVSPDQGLEQEFNSLDNQREAAEAYIKSQAHEGWRCLPGHYDDGGFSGGSMDRPALQRLLTDIRARLVDVVVVYKVDRLTRSLADFAKLVELFDAHEVSFVSVTQAFNTTTSMGRLTLNVLLSFAQFEREVTAERIRDKIAASKRKGMRTGGAVPLGYNVEHKRLVVNEKEAERVRYIFQRYLKLGCLTKLAEDLRKRKVFTKLSRRADGTTRGGIVFTKGPLAYLLKNRSYVGDVVHKGRYFPGEHRPIIEPALFEAVQQKLASRAQIARRMRLGQEFLLSGRIFDDRGNRMTPSTAKKGTARYRYYVSSAIAQGRKDMVGSVARVPAPDLEALVLDAISAQMGPASEESGNEKNVPVDRDSAVSFISRVVVGDKTVQVSLEERDAPLVLPWRPSAATRRRDIILPTNIVPDDPRPIRAESRARLIEGIAKARLWLAELIAGDVKTTHELSNREGCSERSIRMTLGLAFLSPVIVKAAIDGALPRGVGMSELLNAGPDWSTQLDGTLLHHRNGDSSAV